MGALEVAELERLLSLRMGPHIVKNEGVLGLFKGSLRLPPDLKMVASALHPFTL